MLAGYEAAELPPSCLGTRKYIAPSDVPGRDSHMVVAMVARAHSYLQMNYFANHRLHDSIEPHVMEGSALCVVLRWSNIGKWSLTVVLCRRHVQQLKSGCNFTTAGSDRANAGRIDKQKQRNAALPRETSHDCTPSGDD